MLPYFLTTSEQSLFRTLQYAVVALNCKEQILYEAATLFSTFLLPATVERH